MLLTRYCRFLPAGGATAGLGACAPKSERAISSGWGVAPKAKGRTMLLTRYCHTPEGAPGRTWRLRAKVRTSHFERLESYSKKRGADNATDQVLPFPPCGRSHGRTWRLCAKVRTSHFERLGSSSKSQGADNATDQVLPYPRRGPWQDLALTRQSPNEPLRAAEKLFQKARGRQKSAPRFLELLTRFELVTC